MHELPSSIEAYLEEAGFSGTEILILRRLMDGEPLTIRQLGAKTGKSTGVLDQAMKKLMKKNIIKRALINETPKYSLDSLEAVVEWMQEDMEQKREMLLRRHQNFESFVTSLETGSKRPDIEYFEGDSGIKQAYIKLLNGPGEILHYLPVMYKEEEDPLRDFRVQYFRERQLRKMFSRVLAHDTVLGHRYQSRDAFEYRKTVLVSEKEYPFTFEKIITGDRIACIDHNAKTACVIRYPELADVERTLFEAIWRQVQARPAELISSASREEEYEKIAFSTETISRLREFFLSKKSLGALTISVLCAAIITAGIAFYNKEKAIDRIRGTVTAIAATAAIKIDPQDVEAVKTLKDINTEEYRGLVEYLYQIKSQNNRIKYVYLVRPRENGNVFEFVADAEAFIFDEGKIIDTDQNGVIDDADEIALPGMQYDVTHIPLLRDRQYEGPVASNDPYSDQWGTVYSGYAPIRNAQGSIIGIVAVDMDATELNEFGPKPTTVLFCFIIFFAIFFVGRIAAFNRSIFIDLYFLLLKKRFWISFSTIVLILISIFVALNITNKNNRYEIIGKRLMAIAATGAKRFENEDLKSMQFAQDMRTPQYQILYKKLNEIRDANPDVHWAYILRTTSDDSLYEFIADADSNYFLDQSFDYNFDQNDTPDEVNVWPGMYYSFSGGALQNAKKHPSYSKVPETDQWGTFITGAAPIFQNGELVGILGLDYLVE